MYLKSSKYFTTAGPIVRPRLLQIPVTLYPNLLLQKPSHGVLGLHYQANVERDYFLSFLPRMTLDPIDHTKFTHFLQFQIHFSLERLPGITFYSPNRQYYLQNKANLLKPYLPLCPNPLL